MSTLKYDDQGFLVGNKIDLSGAIGLWTDIQKDVSDIKNLLAKTRGRGLRFEEIATPHATASKGATRSRPPRSFVPNSDAFHAQAKKEAQKEANRTRKTEREATKEVAQSLEALSETTQKVIEKENEAAKEKTKRQKAEKKAAEKTKNERDSKGRFVGQSNQGSGEGSEEEGFASATQGAISKLTGQLANALRANGGAADEVDPAIKAVKEIATPLSRGFDVLSGMGGDREKKKEGLIRRLFGELKLFRKESSLFAKVASKRLKGIEEKPNAQGGEGGSWFSGLLGAGASLIAGLPIIKQGLTLLKSAGIGLGITKGATVVAGGAKGLKTAGTVTKIAAGAGEAAGEAGKAGGLLSKLAKFGKLGGGLLKKIPVLGTLLAVSSSAASSALTEWSGEKTRDEKNAEHGKTWGGVAGGLGGMAGGAMVGAALGSFVPVIGTAIGGVLGAIVGGVSGDWFGGEAGEVIGRNFRTWSDALSSGWDEVKIYALGTWDFVSEGAMSAWASISKTATETWASVKEMASTVWADVSSKASALWDTGKSVFLSISDGLSGVVGFYADMYTKAYESLKKLPIIGSALENIEETAKTLKDGAFKMMETATDAVSKAMSDVRDWVGDKWGNAKEKLKNTYQTAKQNLTEKVEQTKEAVTNAVPQGWKDSVEKRRQESNASNSSNSGSTTNVKQPVPAKTSERWNDAKPYLLDAAEKVGVDPGLIVNKAFFESGFNSEAAPTRKDGTRISTAHGYGQFIDATWLATLQKHGHKHGVANAKSLTQKEANSLRGDKMLQAAMLAEHTKDNLELGRKYGGSDEVKSYAFHGLGVGDAPKFLSANDQDSTTTVRDALLKGVTTDKGRAHVEAVISGNKGLYGDGSMSVREACQRMEKAMQRGEYYAADARKGVPTKVADNTKPSSQEAKSPAPVTMNPTAQNKAQVNISTASISAMPSAPTPPISTQAGEPAPVVESVAFSSKSIGASHSKEREIGQDVSDRRIAHIVTGGISSG